VSNSLENRDKFEYAIDLIENAAGTRKATMDVVYAALQVMEFGNITPKEMMYYLDNGRLERQVRSGK